MAKTARFQSDNPGGLPEQHETRVALIRRSCELLRARREAIRLPPDYFSEKEKWDPDFRDRMANGPPSGRVRALLSETESERRRFCKVTGETQEKIRRVWRQLEEDQLRNGKVTTRVRSSGPEARKALERLRWELVDVMKLPAVPVARRGSTRDTLKSAREKHGFLGRQTDAAFVVAVLDASDEVRGRGVSRRDRPAWERAVKEDLAKRLPRQGFVEIEPGGRRTVTYYDPDVAAKSVFNDYSGLADRLRTRRAVQRHFGLDHRTSRLRRNRRTPETHT